jgi:glutaredoxin-like protein NrdH
MSRVKLYTSEECSRCHRTAEILTAKGIDFEEIDVDKLSEAETDELRAQGFQSLPVVITATDAWCGFRADKLVMLTAERVAR